MPTLDEVLNAMSEDDYLYDEVQFIIDENLRTINIHDNGLVLGVVGDRKVNRVNFQMSRYYNGFDMSTFAARVVYTTPTGSENYYSIVDLTVNNNIIWFTWLLDADVTAEAGDVQFAVHMFKMNGNSISQSFKTTSASAKVLPGLSDINESVTPEQQEDIITKITNEVRNNIGIGISNGKGWTTTQINLFDKLLDYLVFSDSSTGQDIANQLLESLRNEGVDDNNPSEETNDGILSTSVTIESISSTYGELLIPLNKLNDGVYLYMLDDEMTPASYGRVSLYGFYIIAENKTKVVGLSPNYNWTGFTTSPSIEDENLKITGSSMSKFHVGTKYNVYNIGGDT